MKKSTRKFLVLVVPIAIFATLLFFLWRGLHANPEVLPSTLVGESTPTFRLTNLMSPAFSFSEQDLKGHVTILNVWASWCHVCEMEHPVLMEIKKKYAVTINGINYRDDPDQARQFLTQLGNPYTAVGSDSTGYVAMDFGVYGTPETFIIDKNGRIVYRRVGMVTWSVWEDEMWPLIKKLQ